MTAEQRQIDEALAKTASAVSIAMRLKDTAAAAKKRVGHRKAIAQQRLGAAEATHARLEKEKADRLEAERLEALRKAEEAEAARLKAEEEARPSRASCASRATRAILPPVPPATCATAPPWDRTSL